MMKTFKNQKGITLVALVITIIILLILAGVAIGFAVNGNGLFDKAKQATEEYNSKAIEEQNSLNTLYGMVEKYTNGGGSTPTTPPKTTYSMGEIVTLGGEKFWVIENSDENTPTVKLLAKLNVITTEGNANRYKQNASANPLSFDDDSNDYGTSEIKKHVDAYKAAVEGRMGSGKTIQEARLMTGTNSSGEVQTILSSTLTNKTDIVYGPDGAKLNYWLGSPQSSVSEWVVGTLFSGLYHSTVNAVDGPGLRPVIVVLKSDI